MAVPFSEGFNPPPPKYIYTPPPLFRGAKDIRDYYVDQEFDRWTSGYAGLTGMHYYYIQECFLKDIEGNIFHPEWRQVDDEDVFSNIEECRHNQQGLMIVKPRDMGLTSIFAGGLPFYYARMNPGSLINMTSKDKDAFVRMFDDKVMTTYENISEYVLNKVPLNKNNTKDQAFLKLAVKKLYPDGSEKVHTTTINVIETSENPKSVTKFSGSRAIYTFIDESGLHKRIRPLLQSMEATMKRGTDRKGFLCLGGTLEAALSNDQILAYQKLLEDVSFFRIKTVFIPAYKTLVMKNGWYDKEAAIKWVMEQREEKAKSSDPSDLRAEIMTYPLSIDDIFQYTKGGFFEDDVEDMLRIRLDEIATNPNPKYKIVTHGDQVKAIPDSNGKFTLLEPPKPNVVYYQAIDGIGGGTDDGAEKGSELASIIFKGYDPDGGSYTPVCIYLERPRTVEDAYRSVAAQLRYYNSYGNFKETNYETNIGTGDHFGTFLKKEGLYQFAAKRYDMTGRGNIDSNKRGHAVNEHVQDWQKRQGNLFLRKFAMNMTSSDLILDLLKPKNENADLRSAFLMFMISIRDFDKPIKVKKKREVLEVTRLVNQGGYNVWKTWKVNLSGENGNAALQNFVNGLQSQFGSDWYNQMERNESLKNQYNLLIADCQR